MIAHDFDSGLRFGIWVMRVVERLEIRRPRAKLGVDQCLTAAFHEVCLALDNGA